MRITYIDGTIEELSEVETTQEGDKLIGFLNADEETLYEINIDQIRKIEF